MSHMNITLRMESAVSLAALFLGIGVGSLSAGALDLVQDLASPLALVRSAVANEVAAGKDDSTKHMFHSRKQTAQGSQTRLYVEARSHGGDHDCLQQQPARARTNAV
jgi:hypothetical protein